MTTKKIGAELQRRILEITNATARGMADGVELAAEHVLAVSNRSVPIEEGVLERSGTVNGGQTRDSSSYAITTAGGVASATVSYDTPYAVAQHEDLTAKHDSGRSAKFLESAVNSERRTGAALIAGQVRQQLRNQR